MPDFDEIVRLAADLSNDVFGPFVTQSARADELYELQFKVPVPKGDYHKHIPPTARAKVDALVDHVIVNNPAVIVTSTLGTPKSEEQSDALELGCDALLQRIDAQRSESIWRSTAKLTVLHGISFLKGPLWMKDPYGDDEPKRRRGESENDHVIRVRVWKEKKKHHMPISARPVPAPNMLWQPGQWPQDFYIETNLMSAKRANDLYDLGLDESQKGWATLVEYWNLDMKAILVIDKPTFKLAFNMFPITRRLVGGSFVKRRNPDDNVLGFLPYLPVSGGFGKPSHKPEEEFKGPLIPADAALVAEARIKTALEAITEEHAFPNLLKPDDLANVNLRTGLGQEVTVPDGTLERIGYVPRPPADPLIFQSLQIQMADIQGQLGSDALQGIRSPGENTIGQQATRIGQSSLRGLTVLESLNRAGSNFCKNVFRLIDVVNEPLAVWGIHGDKRLYEVIKPGNLSDYSPHLSFDPVPPEREDRLIALAISLYQARLMSRQTLRERFLKIKDNTEEELRMFTEKVNDSDQIQFIAAQAAAVEAGMEDIVAQMGGIPGGGGGEDRRRGRAGQSQTAPGRSANGSYNQQCYRTDGRRPRDSLSKRRN